MGIIPLSLLERRLDIGADDEAESSMFEVVVKMRRCCKGGKRSTRRDRNSAMDAEEDIGKDNVGGKPRPANDVRSTLTTERTILE